MIKIAYFNDGPLLPIKEGGAEKIINLLRNENIPGRCEVMLFECLRPWTNEELLKLENFSVTLLPERLFYEDISGLVSVLKTEGIDACIFTNPENILRIGSKIKDYGYKIIYDCHNVYTIFFKRTGEPESRIEYMHFLEYITGEVSDLVLPCSRIDLGNLLELEVSPEKMAVVENGVDTQKINFCGSDPELKTVLFLGNNYYNPNYRAVERIYEYCFKSPILQDFSFIIAGTVPEAMVNKYQSPRFQFTGYVADLNSLFKKASIALAPLTEGSGTRLKLLNYLAAGLPVITTALGMEGLELDNEDLVISDNFEAYPQLIKEILTKPDLLQQSRNTREKIESKYDWKVIAYKAVCNFEKLVQK